jgi:polyhydroxyalkanoate synthesis regulator phasin
MEAREYNKNVKKARSFMKDLSWDVNIGVGYDPNVTIQRKISERLRHIINDIESGTLDRIKMRAKMTELEILKQQLETFNRRNLTAANGAVDLVDKNTDLGDADTTDNLLLTDKTMPKNLKYVKKYAPGDENSPVRQEILTNIESPLASNDYLIRPGYQMTDEEIARRGSRATFDETKVGGADYKKNVKFLCHQIKAAGLGDPSEFGCIANQESEVGPDYSWKGNYKMVCSRLGNTWGSWYPEMFGCPKQDVSHTQMPKINRDCTASSILPPQQKPPAPCVIKESSSDKIVINQNSNDNSNEPTSCNA